MIRNYVKQYEAWVDLDPEDIDLTPGTRKPSEKVLDQLFDDIKYGYLQGVKDYISLDYDVNAKNKQGRTPLIEGISHKAYSGNILELLIEKGADVNAKNNDGNTAMDVAVLDDIKNMLAVEMNKESSKEEKTNVEEVNRVKNNKSFIGI